MEEKNYKSLESEVDLVMTNAVNVWKKVHEALIKLLEKVPGNILEIGNSMCCNLPIVTYDGGNHPEYAANPYSSVYSVYLNTEKNGILVDCDDCSGLILDYLSADLEKLWAIYSVCCEFYEEEFEPEEE